MSAVMICAVVSKRKKLQIFRARPHGPGGFTLIELLMVISIIGILTMIVLPVVSSARSAVYLLQAKLELRAIAAELENYFSIHGAYPPDANNDFPPGVQDELNLNDDWPAGPWPGSVYYWDTWSPGQLQYQPKAHVKQISLRFCPVVGQTIDCSFPAGPWSQNFDSYSAVYQCISGPCRAHSSQPATHPSYCINCNN
jgi:prepilin-type N-terminal cleavage/methylation domain-containing protein